VSTPRTLKLSKGVDRLTIETSRGAFAALEALPATGICERQPALLVPGYTGSKEDFIPVLGLLAAAGRRVFAIDLRGQHESPPAAGAGGYGLGALAADLAAIGDALGSGDASNGPPRRIHLLGHSFGGLVARETALTQPALISSLTLMSSGPGVLTGPRAVLLEAMLTHLRGVPPAALAAEIKRLWETQLEPEAVSDGTPPAIVTFLRTRMLNNCATGMVSMAEILLTCPDRTAALAELRPSPVLVLYGENDDAWAPSIQEEMAKRLAAQRVCIPGAAHSPAVEAPETVASTLTTFWNKAENHRARPDSPARAHTRA
jgi:pimeloyl-ACP methyl ester carboxylesterase